MIVRLVEDAQDPDGDAVSYRVRWTLDNAFLDDLDDAWTVP